MTLELTGTSVSGLGTCLMVPELKLVLDIGVCLKEATRFRDVLVTHTHVDHMAGAVSHAAVRDLKGNKTSRFFAYKPVAEALVKVMELWREVQGEFKYEVVSMELGKEYPMGRGRSVMAFETFHRLTSAGFVVYESRTKLKAEYVGLEGAEIGRLRKSGVEVTDTIKTPVLAYTGDTTVEALADPCLAGVKTLVTEATFMPDKTVAFARERGHTHLDEFAAAAPDCEEIVLTHFSARYSEKDVADAVAALPEGLKDRVRVHTVGL